MNLEELLKQNRYHDTVMDKDYIDRRSKEIDEEVKRKIEFEKRWNEKHNNGEKMTLEELLKQNK